MARSERTVNMQKLLFTIRSTPIIDHHAHNILLPSEQETRPLLSITTEAAGKALQHAQSTLAHMRAVQQLADVLQCEPVWDTVQAHLKAKRQVDDDSWAKLCFSGIETVLIDDGLDVDTVYPYGWHGRLTRSGCKRVVRIEKVAEMVLTRSFESFELLDDRARTIINVTDSALDHFVDEINKSLNDPDIAGFKSVICYRTGLAISQYKCDEDMYVDLRRGITVILDGPDPIQKASRLEDSLLGPAFVHLTAHLIARSKSKKPFQFHTGLGDNDLSLRLASSSHLQPFIEQYPSVPIILLHASYPFTKEAGYLASTYPNAYLDIGEVFPMVSKEGQEIVVREALELCPSEKLMWSTDGHWFPETYLLATLQVRQALEKVRSVHV